MLKTRFNTNEILTSLMLVYIAKLFLDWLARGPFRDPQGYNFPQLDPVSDAAAVLPEIMPMSGRAHWGVFGAVVIAIVAWVMLSKTLKGFEVRVQGSSPRAGRFAGFSASRMVFFTFLLSGGLAGLAGIIEVAGPIGQLREVVSPDYGFTAIIVAFLGRLNPLGIVAAGVVLALTYLGGEQVQMLMGVSDKVARVFQGMLLFFVLACDTLILYRIRISGFGAPKPAAREPDHGHRRSILLTIATAATPLLHRRARRAGGRALRRAQPRRRGHDGDGRGLRLRGRGARPARRGSAFWPA